MGNGKFAKFSFWVLIAGVVSALLLLVNAFLHGSLGSYVRNNAQNSVRNGSVKPEDMIGKDAKF